MSKKLQQTKKGSRWYDRLFRYPELWVLTCLALFTRLWHIGTPPAIVFDEVYFRAFASNYLDGHYYFDIHPPFIKLLFAGVASFFHLSASEVANGDTGIVILRFLPALAGAALVPLVYVILRQMCLGRRIAALGAALVLFDNALLVESRFVLMDSLLLLAGIGAISAYLILRRSTGRYRWLWVVVVGVLLGMLVSTKWSGLAIAGIIAIAWLIESLKNHERWQKIAGEIIVVVSIVASIYISCFLVNFTLLNRSGEGDVFMSQKFQSTLIGNPYYNSAAQMPFWEKFIELNEEMYSAQNSLSDKTHPYASPWFGWPFMARPVYYWQGDMLTTGGQQGAQGHIYLLGNPVVWLIGAVSVLVAFLGWILSAKWLRHRRQLVAFLLGAYAVNFLPFAFIDRPMFLYHYLFALIFSLLLACVLAEQLLNWLSLKHGRGVAMQLYWAGIIIIVLGFLYFLPISYGWPLGPEDLQLRMLFPNWR